MTLSLNAFCRLTDGVTAVQSCWALKATVSLSAPNGAPQNVLVLRSYSFLSRVQRTPAASVQVGTNSQLRWAKAATLVVVRSSSIVRSEEHTSELQSLMRISYAVFCLKKKKQKKLQKQYHEVTNFTTPNNNMK